MSKHGVNLEVVSRERGFSINTVLSYLMTCVMKYMYKVRLWNLVFKYAKYSTRECSLLVFDQISGKRVLFHEMDVQQFIYTTVAMVSHSAKSV